MENVASGMITASQSTDSEAKEAIDLNLDSMTLDDLKTLTRRLACQCGLVATMSEEETAQAMLDRLASIGLDNRVGISAVKEAISAITLWLDRVKGKPAQTIIQNTTITLEQLVLQSYSQPKLIENTQEG